MTMDNPDRMDDLPFWTEPKFSDPDLDFIELFGEDIVKGSRHSANLGDWSLQDDFASNTPFGPAFVDYDVEADVQTQHGFTHTPAVRPTVFTHQPAYVPGGSNEFKPVQEQQLTISPTELGNFDVIVTPPQGQSEVFNAFGTSSASHSQLKTPSLDSGTTYATQQGFPSNDAYQTNEPDYPWMEGLSTTNLSNLSSTIRIPSRAGSLKRSSVDLGDTEGRPKRAKSVTNGYPCDYLDCPKVFNRECDSRKHFKNVHSKKAHCCKLCGKGFPYPKDVRRHMKQIHDIDVPAPQDEKKPRRRFSSLKSVVSMLANLQLWSNKDPTESEEAEDYILVTRDHNDFRKVYLKGVESSEALMREIGSVFGVHLGHVDDALLRRCGSGGRLGKHIGGTQIMAAAKKAVTAGKTLEVFFTIAHDTRNVS